MIQISVKELTLVQRKIINSLIYIAQKTGNCEVYQTKVGLLKDLCNITTMGNDNIKKHFRELNDIKIEFNYLNKDKNNVWEVASLLSCARIIENEGTIEFSFAPFIKEKVLTPSVYTPLDVFLVSRLKSSYSIVLYEFLRDYLTSPVIPKLTIQNLRDLMGIKDNEYEAFKDLRKRVIDVAIKEINDKNDIICGYTMKKEYGNRYAFIQFSVKKKKDQDPFGTVSKECSKDNLELFKESDDSVYKIPEEIYYMIPDRYRTNAVFGMISKFIGKGHDYVVSNIKYTLKNATSNFSGYLNKAFANDYASNDREIETKLKVKTEKIVKHKVEAEKKVISDRIKTEKKLEIMRQLPDKELEKLRKRAITMIKKESPGNEFALSDSLVEMKMADLHVSDHELEKYSGNDLD